MRRLFVSVLIIAFMASLYCLIKRSQVLAQNPPTTYSGTIYATYQFDTLRHPTGLAGVVLGSTFYLFISDSSNNVIRQFAVPMTCSPKSAHEDI